MTDVSMATETSAEEAHALTGRDRAVLRAVAAGRAEFRGGCVPILLVDGLPCSDFGAVHRLVAAGLVAAPDATVERNPATLTPAGRRALS
jgi:hypothetical protein